MSAHSILPVKERLLSLRQQESRELFERILGCRTSAEIHELLKLRTAEEQAAEELPDLFKSS